MKFNSILILGLSALAASTPVPEANAGSSVGLLARWLGSANPVHLLTRANDKTNGTAPGRGRPGPGEGPRGPPGNGTEGPHHRNGTAFDGPPFNGTDFGPGRNGTGPHGHHHHHNGTESGAPSGTPPPRPSGTAGRPSGSMSPPTVRPTASAS